MTHETTVRQLLGGHELPEGPTCDVCLSRLREGARIGVLATRADNETGWRIDHIYCREHALDEVPVLPLGETAIADADLGSLVNTGQQTHAPALVDVTIEDCALGEQSDRKAVEEP
jgi:hypothetical protein